MAFMIEITHVPTGGPPLQFEPYLDSFSDNYKSDWKTDNVLGRMDSISTFTRTSRVINISFTVVSRNYGEACQNYKKSQILSDYLYPVYKTVKNSKKEKGTVRNPLPQNRVKPGVQNFYKASELATTLEEKLNLRNNTSIMSAPPILKIKFSNLISEKSNNDGLYGYVEGFNFKPNTELGYFLDEEEDLIVPKSYKVDLTFTVIHVNARGWTTNNQLR